MCPRGGSLRFREVESAPALALLNTGQGKGPDAFRAAMAYFNSTFNWVDVDDKDLVYFHSGRYPVRAPGVDPDLPSWGTGEWEWQGLLPTEQHPFEVNPRRGYFVSWNNKPARSWRAADANFAYGPVYRSLALEVRLRRALRRGRVDLPGAVDVMADAATVDLRGQTVLPEALALVHGDRSLRAVIRLLHEWAKTGAHRIDRDGDGHYDDDAAVALMDAWYPRLVHAAFDAELATVYGLIPMGFDDAPSNSHVGSAYQDGYYGYLDKMLRQAVGRRVRGRYRGLRCADGTRGGAPRRCARACTMR